MALGEKVFSRTDLINRLRNEEWDILILGGGATGAGAALDAASRGLRVALIDARDFSAGTSSRSTKLVHGGVRYLELAFKHLDRGQYALVRDALRERKHFLENAPHLSNPLPILTPVYSWFAACYYLIGLKLYDFVAGSSSLGESKFISKEIATTRFPMLKTKNLKGAVVYYDGQFDDARMNIALIATAIKEGAVAANYVRSVSLIKEDDKIKGVVAHDEETNETWPIRAKIVVNATGCYADAVRKMDNPNANDMIMTSQGSHIVLPAQFSDPNNGLIIPKTSDGRVIFLLPWLGHTVAGTTDQPEGVVDLPEAKINEVDYILEHVRKYFAAPVSRADVLATWSGLRPLANPRACKKTANISRDHMIEISDANLLTVVGGKWTTYRKMAEDVVDTAITTGKLSANACRTHSLKLVGGENFSPAIEATLAQKIDPDIAAHLARSFGDRAFDVLALHDGTLTARLIDGYPYIEAEVIYGVTNEFARHVTDILARRMRVAFLDNQAARMAVPKVATLMAKILLWNDEKVAREIAQGTHFLNTMKTKG